MTPSEIASLSEQTPGDDENFLNSDFAALISGDHVLTINCGQNAASLRTYLHGLFREANFDDEASMFDIVRIADARKLARIEAAGAESIGLQLGISEATTHVLAEQQQDDGMMKRLSRPILSLLEDLTREDAKVAEIASSLKGTVKLAINVPAGDLEQAKAGLDGIAEELVEDDEADQFIIKLRNGESIKPSEVAIKKRIRVTRNANSVNIDEVWGEMGQYMSELRTSEHLET